MADTKFTPGPWFVGDGETVTVRDSVGNMICISTWMNSKTGIRRTGAEVFANGRVMAAAPDLYESLAALLASYTSLVNCGDCGNWDPETEPAVIAARAALAKAT